MVLLMVEDDNKGLFEYFNSLYCRYCAGLLCLSFSISPAHAEWHGSVNFSSDYVYRGYSKSRGNPIVQGHVEYLGEKGWFLGSGLSQVSFDNHSQFGSADLEATPYLGQSLQLSPDWLSELMVSGYIFNDKIAGTDSNYVEYHATVHYQDWLTAKVDLAPNAHERHAIVTNYELSYRRDIVDNVRFSTALGYLDAKSLMGQNFFYWHAGASWFVTANLSLEIQYVAADQQPHIITGPIQYDFFPRPLQRNFMFSVSLGF